VRFFLKGDECVGNVQLSLQLSVAFLELDVASLSLTELWLATGLFRRESLSAMGTELGTPR